MKKYWTTSLLFIFLTTVSGFSQERTASFSFGNDKFNFGTIKESDGPVSHSFEFINNGGSPLVIQNVVASCGCTTPEWSKNPIPPGGKGFIKATFDPTGRPGTFSKTITITSNASKPNYILSFNGSVTPRPITTEEQYNTVVGFLRYKSTHASFQSLTPKSVKTDTLEFLNSGKTPVSIGFSELPVFIKVVAVPTIVKPSGKGKLIVTYLAAKRNDWGFLIDHFYLNVNGKQDKQQKITVSSTIEEDFSQMTAAQIANAPHIVFDKSIYNFGSVKQGEMVNGSLSFKNTGKSVLMIRKIETGCDCTVATTTTKEIQPGATAILKIAFDSHKQKNSQNKTITVTSNDPKNIRTVLYVKGNVE